jgi:hypothetical protein
MRFRRLATVALLAMAMALVPAAGAGARTPRPRSLGHAVSAIRTDGARFAVYMPRAGELTVRDDLRRTRRTIPFEDGCDPLDVARGGHLLVGCGGASGSSSYHVQSLRTGAVEGISAGGQYEGYGEIGTRWLAGIYTASAHQVIVYVNWHTGASESASEVEEYVPRDLDSPDLRPLGPKLATGTAFAFDRPFAATDALRGPHRVPLLTLFENPSVHGFGRRVAKLDTCPAFCGSISNGGGIVTWVNRATVHGYAIGSRRRFAWRFADAGPAAPPIVAHTRTTVYESQFRPPDRIRLRAIRWR